MSAEFRLAMPVGSRWVAMNHVTGATSKELVVKDHHPHRIELVAADGDGRYSWPYPLANQWRMQRDHVRIGWDGELKLTFAPA